MSEWVIDFYVEEPPSSLHIPQPHPPARADNLWRTTCFELFLQRDGEEGYYEFNFSPSGLWAAYRFDGYRRNGENLEMDTPIIEGPSREQNRLAHKALYERRGLEPDFIGRMWEFETTSPEQDVLTNLRAVYDAEPFASGGPWWVGLSAVIEEAHGAKSYWALHHPSDKPDFHHPDSFVLELA